MKKFIAFSFVFVMLLSVSAFASEKLSAVDLSKGSLYTSHGGGFEFYDEQSDSEVYVDYSIADEDYVEGMEVKLVTDENGNKCKQYVYPDGRVVTLPLFQNSASSSVAPVSDGVTAPITTLDAAIDDLCAKYSITEQDLYFHLLKSILNSCE